MNKILLFALALLAVYWGSSAGVTARAETSIEHLEKASFKLCNGGICRFDIESGSLWVEMRGFHVPRFPGGCRASLLLANYANELATDKLNGAKDIKVSELGAPVDYRVDLLDVTVPLRPGKIEVDGQDLGAYLLEKGAAIEDRIREQLLAAGRKDVWCDRGAASGDPEQPTDSLEGMHP